MRSAQIRLHQVLNMYRRRWKLVVFPTIAITVFSTLGAFLLPRKYEATTTMLTRPDETLNMVRGYDPSAYEDQLQSYGEIIYSNGFVQAVIDSLGIGRNIQTEFERQALLNEVKRMIATDRRSDAFSITFANSKPELAQRGAEVVANLFIQTQVRMGNRENLLTIEFLERKVDELRAEFENNARSLVASMQQAADELPTETRSLYTQLTDIEGKVVSVDERVKLYRRDLSKLQTVIGLFRSNPDALRNETGKQPLLDLQREDLPYATEFRALVSKYDELTRRYTGKWPEIEKLEGQIVSLLDRMRLTTEDLVSELQTQRSDAETRRGALLDEVKKSSAVARINQDKQSSFELSQKLYNDMKAKLEQARIKAEIESKGASQYFIIDPPVYPAKPTKPNRRLFAMAGFGLGLCLGVVSVIIAELFDTTIRTSKDVEIYEKPIIALLPDGGRELR